MQEPTPDFESLKPRMKATWTDGDFGEIAKSIETHAEEFVARRRIEPGTRVLDVACGTGNVALAAARAGADVTGVDIAENLLRQARERAAREGLSVRFDEGDAEDLPYDDGAFDLVLSMYGVMFAPRPDLAAAELVRVCRPGGTIAMANWTRDGFIGQMGALSGRHVPPPPGLASPTAWSDEAVLRERLGEEIEELHLTKVTVALRYPFPVEDTVEYFRTYFGPTKRGFASLSEDGRAAFRRDLEGLWARNNRATDGTTHVESEYLEVVALRA